jgi:hypothetical protein
LGGLAYAVTTITANNRDICPPTTVLSFQNVVIKVKDKAIFVTGREGP